ncbi:MAG: response regulator transcription factor [Acidobacteria bacterium]|nr:response regulator transcription factor [Acidobacteriota bacterium]
MDNARTETATIRILCVEDHRLVREGIAALLGQQADMRVVTSAATAEEGIVQFRLHRPDVTLMDLQLPGMSGLDAIREILREAPAARVIVLTMYHGEEDVYRALEAGAMAYVLKDTLSDDLIHAIRDVHRGKRPIASADVQSRLAERNRHKHITPRELQVIELVSQGMRNKEIAASLGISEETVQVHLRNIYLKLNVNDRTAVLAVAVRRGLIHLK